MGFAGERDSIPATVLGRKEGVLLLGWEARCVAQQEGRTWVAEDKNESKNG